MSEPPPVNPPRYTHLPLPPYAYVPGSTPHPVSDPRGHMHGRRSEAPPPLDPADWQASEPYLYGVDLFNNGFYWEAHEAWESLWLAAGRRGQTALWLKILIRFAAAMVKVRAGNAAGACRHAIRAQELTCEFNLADEDREKVESYCGVDRGALGLLTTEIWGIADRSPASFRSDAQLPLGIALDYPS